MPEWRICKPLDLIIHKLTAKVQSIQRYPFADHHLNGKLQLSS